MAEAQQIEILKRILRTSVSRFCRHDDRQWKRPILRTLDVLRACHWQSVFFGGTLRSLLLSCLANTPHARPRDIDIVIGTPSIDDIHKQFAKQVHRMTRFGGLQLHQSEWQFDVWPLNKTWAFVEDSTPDPSFEALPETTFFNLEAIAIDLWPDSGKPRAIYSGNDQFFSGLLDRVLEINRPSNPFPELCVVRALVMASSIQFKVGPLLASYIAQHGDRISIRNLEEIQRKHYGLVRRNGQRLKTWIRYIQNHVSLKSQSSIELPCSNQMTFWPMEEFDADFSSLTIRDSALRRRASTECKRVPASVRRPYQPLEMFET